MKSIKVLDVTLRDGGCVNNFDFGQEYMDKILVALEKSCVDYIELGYIDENKGSEQGRTQYLNEEVIVKNFLKNKKENINYVAMVDYGKFNTKNLKPREDSDIDGIRMAFHKKNRKDIIDIGRQVIDKGYKFFVQPMLTMRYSDMELLELIQEVNDKLPDATAFYIVDSFGEMRSNDVTRLVHLVDNNLNKNISLGFHSHNNLQLSYSNAMELLTFPSDRELIIDSSIMGMGKGAGNLNTELLLEHMNLYYGKRYKTAPLFEVIDQVINVIHKDIYWGYAVEYYLSSINRCTPSYASHFYNKHMLSIDQLAELLSMIPEEKKISFDKDFAEQLYLKYNADKIFDESEYLKELIGVFKDKSVLLIAPGKSILNNESKVKELQQKVDVSVELNNSKFSCDFMVITKKDIFDDSSNHKGKIIVPSNVSRKQEKNVFILNYSNWIGKEKNDTFDSSGIIILNLLKTALPKKIYLAGFDGFSSNINENYYNLILRKPVSEDRAEAVNVFHKKIIADIGKIIPIEFVTPSKYE